MAVLPVRKIPDPILRMKAESVSSFDAELETLVRDMWETMYDSKGIGLAGPQVGVSKRVVVVDLAEEGSEKIVLINPEIIQRSGKIRSEEGCLSIPDFRETIPRAAEVKIKAQNLKGESFEIIANELLGRCFQHEIDHLDGVLFVDHLSRLKREMFKRWLVKNPEFDDPAST